jgi:hypothetical protein
MHHLVPSVSLYRWIGLRGKSTGFFFGNHGSFPPDMGFLVDFPLNQSSDDGKTMVKTDDSFPMIIVFQQIW